MLLNTFVCLMVLFISLTAHILLNKNGVVERKHRHLVESALTMLSHSQLLTSYWSYAISIVVHIVNRLSTPNLQNLSPQELLFHSRLDLKHLRTFGCDCFPLLKPYNTYKLQPHTSSCIFLGYPAYTKGYICLDPITSRIYISINILFNETDFLTSQYLSISPTHVSFGQSQSLEPITHQFSRSASFVPLYPLSLSPSSPTPSSQGFPLLTSSPTQSIPLPSSDHILTFSPTLAIQLSDTSQSPSQSQPTTLSIPPVLSPSLVSNPSATVPHVPSAIQVPSTTNSHPIVTRSKNDIYKPKAMLAKVAPQAAKPDYTITEPPFFKVAVQYPQWCKWMRSLLPFKDRVLGLQFHTLLLKMRLGARRCSNSSITVMIVLVDTRPNGLLKGFINIMVLILKKLLVQSSSLQLLE